MQLLVDSENKRAITSLFNDRQARIPTLQAGDALPLSVGEVDLIEFPFNARLFNPQDLTGVTYRAALGGGLSVPVGGWLSIDYLVMPESTTGEMEVDFSAAELESELNALGNIVNAGGLAVSQPDTDERFFIIKFNDVGARSLFTLDVSNLAPLCIADIQRIVTGDGQSREVQALRIVPNAAALATLTTAAASAGIGFTTVQAGGGGHNHQVRVVLTGNVYNGTWLFETSGGQSGPIGYDDSEAQVKNVLEATTGIGTGNVSVVQEAVGQWLITFIGTKANTAITGVDVDGTNLVAIPEKSGTLDLAVPGVSMLLNGSDSRLVSLEIERLNGADAPEKILSRDVLLRRPVIEPAMTSPTAQPSMATEIASFIGSSPLVSVSAAGTTALAPTTSFSQWYQKISAGAGAGAYTAKFTLAQDEAVAGAIYRILIALPQSGNPTIKIYDGTIAGTELLSITGDSDNAGNFMFEAIFDGTNWSKLNGAYVT